MKVSFYADEDITPRLAEALRSAGFDAISAHEVGACTLSDVEQLERAASAGRVFLTSNHHDFVGISHAWARERRDHAGIIIFYRQVSRHRIGAVVALLEALFSGEAPSKMTNVTLTL